MTKSDNYWNNDKNNDRNRERQQGEKTNNLTGMKD